MGKRSRRLFTTEQKYAMLQDIETCLTVREGLEKHQLCHFMYQKWKRYWVWVFGSFYGTANC